MNNELTPLDKEFNLDRYWNILKSRSHILIFCILLALLGGLIKSMSIVPRYSAKGVLMIAPEREGTITFNDRLAISRPNTEYFNTQVRILKSRSLARKVTEELDRSSFQPVPEATPETPEAGTKEDAGKKTAPTVNPNINAIPDQQIAVRHVDSFLSGLKVTPIRNTRLVEVSFDSLRPRRAAVAVNTVFDKYIEFNRELISRSTREASDFISQQIKELQKRLSLKEEELQNYSKDKDIFLLNNQQDAEVGKFSDLNTAVTNATIERINHQSLYLELKDKKFEDYPAVRNNSLISTLKTTHSNLEADYKRKTQLFKESYPEMTKLKTQMETLQQRINQETVNIAQQNLKDAKTQYESALKRERAMQKLLSGQKKEIVKDKTNAIHYKSLSIEVQNMRNLLDFLDRKQRETVMASSNHEGAELSN
ncbi:MAG: hypothetical protein GY757_51580, partial [bacterium]|nr:hypothetical protein [bacterium]